MRSLVFLTALCVLAAGPCFAAAEVVFFSLMPDVPVMPGLSETEDQASMFDKPQGRIVESQAQGDSVPAAKIRAYYAAVLPQFGWVPAGQDSFARGGERLNLRYEDAREPVTLYLTITPE